MKMNTNPEYYGLSKRIKLQKITENEIGIVKIIKSRIIQKNAIKIIAIATKIQSKHPEITVSLICNNNICSKSKALLKAHHVELNFI